ncbi:hypothetical protein [Hyphomicrobium sp. DY-1]|uniref:hypothetical protein n=1 Tax=Hyphomicrobium sp. DY-1 TaxID=3075650 RepID=UPI0039C3A79C
MWDFIQSSRTVSAKRFSKKTDWLRLIVLSFMISLYCLIGFLLICYQATSSNLAIGMTAAFTGITTIVMTSKIARPDIYLDWMLNGAFVAVAGLILVNDKINDLQFAASGALLLLSALTRVWIGITAYPRRAAQWIGDSGYLGTVGALWAGCALIFDWKPSLPTVLEIDIFVEGLCIAAFGIALHRSDSNRSEVQRLSC